MTSSPPSPLSPNSSEAPSTPSPKVMVSSSKRHRSPSPSSVVREGDENGQQQRGPHKKLKLALRPAPSWPPAPVPNPVDDSSEATFKHSSSSTPAVPRIRTPKPKPQKRKRHHHPNFTTIIGHLTKELQPLVSTATGIPHPEFPTSLLKYHLLTHSQLDDLAVHYHQVFPPVPETTQYPLCIKPWVGTESNVDLNVKRRRFGRFIGMRGCESPTILSSSSFSSSSSSSCSTTLPDAGRFAGMLTSSAAMRNRVHRWRARKQRRPQRQEQQRDEHGDQETVEEMLERMDREWNRSLARARQHDWDMALGRKWRFYR